jgi:uncharacterized damage-inducible protein DinB
MPVAFPDVPIPAEAGPVVQSLMRFFRDVHQTFWHTIECFYAAELDWKPSPNTDSIGAITDHVIAAERNWLEQVLLQQAPPAGAVPTQVSRSRPEHPRSGVTADVYLADLAEQYRRIMLFMAGLTDEQLQETRRSRSGREVTVEWVIQHLIAHVAYHTGQIVYISMLDGFPE